MFEQPFGNELKFVESSDIQDVSWIDDATKKSFHLQCADATYEVSATDESVTTWFACVSLDLIVVCSFFKLLKCTEN